MNDTLTYLTSEEILQKEFEYYKKAPGKLTNISQKNEIVKFFQQDNFYRYEKAMWQDEATRKAIIENRCKYLNKTENELTDNDILMGFKRSGMHYGYSHFSPLLFKWFIEKYNVKRCYDACGGWGHRLLGAQDLELYIYNDLSTHTAECVIDIADYFGITNTVFINADAREFTPYAQFEYDAMFTCPPYFNLEEYECGPFPSYEKWAGIIDVMHICFDNYKKCKTMGIVIREDLLPTWHHDYTEKFPLNVHKSQHLMKNATKKSDEYLFVWRKD